MPGQTLHSSGMSRVWPTRHPTILPPTPGTSSQTHPKHERFIAFSAKRTVTFWDTSTHNQHPLTFQHPEDIRFFTFSLDDRILAIAGGGKITTLSLLGINVSATFCRAISSLNSFLDPAFSHSVPHTSYFPRTRRPNRRRYTQLVEARSPRKRGSIIVCVDQPLAESEPPCTH